ncbi:hypothetical protein ACSHWB_47700 [Lentzea sp. HUAS TT2]|uniref:hypothetical protein n=1 Tax=Lentzea sp. HUAS TT2 TaxID=3447454 RepID=UPI003F71E211
MIAHQAYRPASDPARARALSAHRVAARSRCSLPGLCDVRHRVVNPRHDGLRERTTAPSEDLHVAELRRTRRLPLAIAGLTKCRRHLEYKTRSLGSHLIVADRWLPLSKTRADRGVAKAEDPLHVGWWP